MFHTEPRREERVTSLSSLKRRRGIHGLGCHFEGATRLRTLRALARGQPRVSHARFLAAARLRNDKRDSTTETKEISPRTGSCDPLRGLPAGDDWPIRFDYPRPKTQSRQSSYPCGTGPTQASRFSARLSVVSSDLTTCVSIRTVNTLRYRSVLQ